MVTPIFEINALPLVHQAACWRCFPLANKTYYVNVLLLSPLIECSRFLSIWAPAGSWHDLTWLQQARLCFSKHWYQTLINKSVDFFPQHPQLKFIQFLLCIQHFCFCSVNNQIWFLENFKSEDLETGRRPWRRATVARFGNTEAWKVPLFKCYLHSSNLHFCVSPWKCRNKQTMISPGGKTIELEWLDLAVIQKQTELKQRTVLITHFSCEDSKDKKKKKKINYRSEM